METEEPAWTIDDLRKLLHAMKQNIPKRDTNNIYTKGLRCLQWKKVAFQPYSPEECQKKWQEISQKIRKIRSLTELIVEAEGAIDDPIWKPNYMIDPQFPKKPNPPNGIFLKENWAKFQKQHPDLRRQDLFVLVNDKYKKLPEHQKAKYVKKFQLASEEYAHRLLQLREQHHRVKGMQQLFLQNTENPQTRQGFRTHSKREEFLQASPDEREQHPEGPETSTVQPNPSLDSRELKSGSMPVKPPKNGYNLFCKEQWTSREGVSGKGFIAMCAQLWRQLTLKQKDVYKMRCRQLMKEYKIKLSQYLSGKEQQVENATGKPRRFAKKVKPIRTFLGEPKMPPRSGNAVFFSEQMKFLKHAIPQTRERMAKISSLWQTLSKNEKENYKKKAEDNMRKYTVELQKWFETLTAEEQADYRKHKHNKCQFLDISENRKIERQKQTHLQVSPRKYRPSDSEDEDIEDSSSEEDEEKDSDSEGEEEEEDTIMFGMH